jgi:hypothetical protein
MKERYRNKERREARQKEATHRKTAYEGLTVAQKLAKLDQGGFTAKKQRERLAKPTASEKAIPTVPAEPQQPQATPEERLAAKKARKLARAAKAA